MHSSVASSVELMEEAMRNVDAHSLTVFVLKPQQSAARLAASTTPGNCSCHYGCSNCFLYLIGDVPLGLIL